MTAVVEGQKVPAFSAEATGGTTLVSDDLLGRPVVLWFYPKDLTPGCTREGKDFRDHYSHFERYDAIILGVSRDSLSSHEKFRAKHGLPFELISDPDGTLCELFGVIKEKSMYAQTFLGIERSTFLIDSDGRLRRTWRKVSIKGHVEDVLAALAAL